MQIRTFCNLECLHCFCSLSKRILNALKRYYVWPWNALTVMNKIVFTSLEAMVEFSGKKLKPKRLSKTPLTYVNLYSFERSRYFFVGRKQNSPITSHAKLALCKECNQIFLFSFYNRTAVLVSFHCHLCLQKYN